MSDAILIRPCGALGLRRMEGALGRLQPVLRALRVYCTPREYNRGDVGTLFLARRAGARVGCGGEWPGGWHRALTRGAIEFDAAAQAEASRCHQQITALHTQVLSGSGAFLTAQ
jgi:hypothetical protein